MDIAGAIKWVAILGAITALLSLGYCVIENIKEQGRNEIEKQIFEGESDAAKKMEAARREFRDRLSIKDPAVAGGDGIERLLRDGQF